MTGMSMTTAVGRSEARHVTKIREGDLVWDDDLGRWRRVTQALRYTTEVGKHDMVKLVFDITTWIRHAANEETTYQVLLDDEPPARVAPETATARRRRVRGKASADAEETAPETTRDASETASESPAGTDPQVGDVRARREALGIARAKFAELCGLTAGALWRVEDGRPKSDELAQVLRTLETEEARK